MFSTLETTWDRSARRGWTTFVSFTFQALALSLLLLIPLFSIQGPPRLEWLRTLVAPTHEVSTPPMPVQQQRANTAFSNIVGTQLMAPQHIPLHAQPIVDIGLPPQIGSIGRGSNTDDIQGAIPVVGGPTMPILSVKTPPVARQFKTSVWAEGNLTHKVAPAYPQIARMAHVQGLVQLHAIISKDGTIENLVVESGHPMLVKAALQAVQQWRYRPYLLNHEPVEVETEITVNFTLGGS